jgi:hypothetical protein
MGLFYIRFNKADDATAYTGALEKLDAAAKAWNAEKEELTKLDGNAGKSDDELAKLGKRKGENNPIPLDLFNAVKTAQTELDAAEKKGGMSIGGFGLLMGVGAAVLGAIAAIFMPILFPCSQYVLPAAFALVMMVVGGFMQKYRFPDVAGVPA